MVIVDLFIEGIILWVASRLFPSIVHIDSTFTLVMVTLLLWLVAVIIRIGCVVVGTIGLFSGNLAMVFLSVTAALFANVFALVYLSNHLSGFEVVGLFPAMLLALCFSICHVYTE